MLRKFIMNNNFLRNVGLISFDLDNYPDSPGNFTPYFQYEIAPYQDAFTLYFPKLPTPKQYYNYIFLKLFAYNPQDAIKYIEVHYDAYPDKKNFLLFLQRQLQYRSARAKKGSNIVSIAAISLDWVNEQMNYFKDQQKIVAYNQFIRQDLTFIVYIAVEKDTKIQLKSIPLQQVINPSLCSQQRDTKCWTWRRIIRSYYYILRRG